MGRFIGMQGRGTIALPPDIRKRHGLDVPGAQVEVVERDDGVIELHPHLPTPLLRLTTEDSAFFARALVDDARPAPALRAAMKRHSGSSSASRSDEPRGASRRTPRS